MTRWTKAEVPEAEIEPLLTPWRQRLDSYLERILPHADTTPAVLHEALRYSTIDAGKRLRACLVYLTGDMLNAGPDDLDAPAAAVELIHAYSLVHDDLPCMDDDDLRRGKASCHRAYGEATALLVGDALQSLAFELLASGQSSHPDACPRLIRTLAKAAGSQGMAGGQALDLAAEGKVLELPALQQIHAMKTAALIEAAVLMGAQAAGITDQSELQQLSGYARALGLGFQIRDDILDVVSDTATLGKNTGADEINNKATYPALIGLDGAREAALSTHLQASAALGQLPYNTQNLQMLADYAINRIY